MISQGHLQVYDLCIKTYSPTFIGGGSDADYMKKEYYFDEATNKVVFLHQEKFLSYIINNNLVDSYESYILSNSSTYLKDFLDKHNIYREDIKDLITMETDAKHALSPGKSLSQIFGFVSDKYHRPYIPGSSIKGAFLTAILYLKIKEYRISAHDKNIEQKYRDIWAYAKNLLKGISFSDSEPINQKDMILTRKDDLLPNGKVGNPNVVRQCIKPNVQIKLKLTIDTKAAKMDVDYIRRAITEFSSFYKSTYLAPYKNYIHPIVIDNFISLGGGSGYHGKNIVYPMLGKEEAVKVVSEILDKRFKKHKSDVLYGMSPRCLKCTKLANSIKYHHMGICEVNIK